jgi:DMSO/TMAO reductase YedYZ molybdopterin-dependent catalytic subunit
MPLTESVRHTPAAKTRQRIIALSALLVMITLAGCDTASSGGGPSGTGARVPEPLDSVEVTSYKGEKLGEISEFRENSIKGPQKVDREKYRLRVDGLVSKPRSYTYAQVLSGNDPRTKVVTLDCVEGWSVKVLWEGVLISDLIDASKADPKANTVIFHAVDGYTTSLPLAHVVDRKILMAYRMNGVTLPADRGFPFQVVAEDKWGYKWCRWVERIELSDDPSYRGYWEQRGYSRSGDLDKPSFGQ